jgi:hypothetical protein
MHRGASLLMLGLLASLMGCGAFPQPRSVSTFDDGLSADEIFAASLAAHGGDIATYPGDINIATDGRWYALIQRIQAVVSDAAFRVTSEERFRPRDGIYAVRHGGPAGSKYVLRTRSGLRVHYNGVPVAADDERLRATAMTNDAFQLFHFGPSFVKHRATSIVRLPDAREKGRNYRRVLATLSPGFGNSTSDQVVLWIDAGTSHLFRVHITLEGFETTRGAHVDTTFLAYQQVGPFLLPSRFSERVRGPLRVKAHEWHVTAMDIDRGWTDEEVDGDDLSGRAAGSRGVGTQAAGAH